MDQINIMKWMLEVDLNKTKEFYSKDIEMCNCLYCKNFAEACKHIDPSIMKVFSALEINPAKPSHLSEFGELEDGLRFYIGSYHIMGKLVEGEYSTDSNWNDSNTTRIENFTFGFKEEALFVHDELQQPVLQLDFEARVPWKLTENPDD